MRYFSKSFYIFLLILLLLAVPVVGAKLFLKEINLGTNDEEELKGDITFVSNRTDKRDEIEALINEFEELNPKVNVELELIGDAETILQRKASVGELPDVTLVPSNISKNEYANYFLTIDDLGFNDNNIYNYRFKKKADLDKKVSLKQTIHKNTKLIIYLVIALIFVALLAAAIFMVLWKNNLLRKDKNNEKK